MSFRAEEEMRFQASCEGGRGQCRQCGQLVNNNEPLITLQAIMKCVSRSKSAAVKDIDIDIADILGKKYRNRIDMDKGDIDPPLLHVNFDFLSFTRFQYCISSIFLHV